MKIKIILTGILACGVSLFQAHAVKEIDRKTVYTPALNICISSFGELIQSREVVILPQPEERIQFTKERLTQWIFEANQPGFYAAEFDTTDFYWQFIETKKYIGVILLITGDPIEDRFYTSLGAGLSVEGRNRYGLESFISCTGDTFSFVVCKESYRLLHFENWKFTNGKGGVSWMTRSLHKDLLYLRGQRIARTNFLQADLKYDRARAAIV